MSSPIEWSACEKARDVLARLGRTEDVMFSPSARRLAVAGFHADRIAVFEIAVEASPRSTVVRLTDAVEVEAPTLHEPHGLCFLDEHTLAVANRSGAVEIFDAPAPGASATQSPLQSRRSISGGTERLIRTPGSVAAFPIDADTLELLVCNNYSHTVSRHTLDRRADYAVRSDEVLLARGMSIPDGICVSPDGAWLAVSNHNTHNVFLYDRARPLRPGSEPDGILRNVLCPHGVRFTADLEHVLVADAAAPCINVYEKNGSSWKGTRDPAALFPVMDDAVFRRGRHNPQEGGPKGIDIHPEGTVLVSTCETEPLAFFALADVLRGGLAPVHRHRRYVQWRLAMAMFSKLGVMAGKPA